MCFGVSLVPPSRAGNGDRRKAVAIRVQLGKRLSLIPGWAGFAAPRPELGVEQRGLDGAPFFYFPPVLPRR